MIIQVIFLVLLMSLMENRFPFNERAKTFLFCKLLPSLDFKKVLFTTLSTRYTDCQRLLLCKLLPYLGKTKTYKTSRDILYY